MFVMRSSEVPGTCRHSGSAGDFGVSHSVFHTWRALVEGNTIYMVLPAHSVTGWHLLPIIPGMGLPPSLCN